MYTGVANDLKLRIYQHKEKLVEGFTKKYQVNKLVYFEVFKYVNEALYREKQLKKWKRQWKMNLIEAINPNWDDLSVEMYQ